MGDPKFELLRSLLASCIGVSVGNHNLEVDVIAELQPITAQLSQPYTNIQYEVHC